MTTPSSSGHAWPEAQLAAALAAVKAGPGIDAAGVKQLIPAAGGTGVPVERARGLLRELERRGQVTRRPGSAPVRWDPAGPPGEVVTGPDGMLMYEVDSLSGVVFRVGVNPANGAVILLCQAPATVLSDPAVVASMSHALEWARVEQARIHNELYPGEMSPRQGRGRRHG